MKNFNEYLLRYKGSIYDILDQNEVYKNEM